MYSMYPGVLYPGNPSVLYLGPFLNTSPPPRLVHSKLDIAEDVPRACRVLIACVFGQRVPTRSSVRVEQLRVLRARCQRMWNHHWDPLSKAVAGRPLSCIFPSFRSRTGAVPADQLRSSIQTTMNVAFPRNVPSPSTILSHRRVM
jgi:hypothetical protein